MKENLFEILIIFFLICLIFIYVYIWLNLVYTDARELHFSAAGKARVTAAPVFTMSEIAAASPAMLTTKTGTVNSLARALKRRLCWRCSNYAIIFTIF
jgi:hypothetical protein